jgi:YD repeat-containing protein
VHPYAHAFLDRHLHPHYGDAAGISASGTPHGNRARRPHVFQDLRARASHHRNFLALVPVFYFEQCGQTDPDVWEWPQNYGSHGLVTAVVIDENRISLEYDGRGRPIRYDSPGYVTATCAYDEAGNLTLWTRDARSGAERFRLCIARRMARTSSRSRNL